MDVTPDIANTLRWMIADMNFRRQQTGMEETPLSPEMQTAQAQLDEMDAGLIQCVRQAQWKG